MMNLGEWERRLDASAPSDGAVGDLLAAALTQFGEGLRIACSFGVEDMVVVHEAARVASKTGFVPRIFLLDTGRLHQETYDLVERTRERYGLPIEVYAPDTIRVEELVRRAGPNSFRRSVADRQECCRVRKLGPLARALDGASAWVTGLRREQSSSRATVRIVEHDASNGLVKLSPLAHWTKDRLWSFVRANDIPTHELHAQGFTSIGCAPCTRAVAPDETDRAGRWWWEDETHKECGLHARGYS